MAKHKKRKSPPRFPDKPSKPIEEEEPQPADTGVHIPKPQPIDEDVPPPTDIRDFDVQDKNRKLDQLFWLRIILAAVAGVTAVFIFEPVEGEERRWAAIGYMALLFLATIFVAKSMRIPLPKSDRKKIVTQGIFSYIFLFLFIWVLTYTVVFALGTPTVVSPF